MRLVTIGVYGFTKEQFFQRLQDAGVDILIDIRQRRGVRGATYAFANSQRLQTRLRELSIGYQHRKDLAPSADIRARQHQADREAGVAKRQRTAMAPGFVAAYQAGVLSEFDPEAFFRELPPDVSVVALLCVETNPEACHRSLVADRLEWSHGLEAEHLKP